MSNAYFKRNQNHKIKKKSLRYSKVLFHRKFLFTVFFNNSNSNSCSEVYLKSNPNRNSNPNLGWQRG